MSLTCPNCHQPTARLIIDKHGSGCAACRGLSENAGANVTGILTRTSDRVRQQQQQFEGDMIVPHRYDAGLGRVVPNEEFVAKYPGMLPTYFTEQELKDAGYSKPDKIYEAKAAQEAAVEKEREQVEFAADPDGEKVAEVVNAVQ